MVMYVNEQIMQQKINFTSKKFFLPPIVLQENLEWKHAEL